MAEQFTKSNPAFQGIPARSWSFTIPNVGEVWKDPNDPAGTIYARGDKGIQQINLEPLGQSLFTPSSQYPTYGNLPAVERQNLGAKFLAQQGVDVSSIPSQNYNLADVFSALGQPTPLSDYSLLRGGVIAPTSIDISSFTPEQKITARKAAELSPKSIVLVDNQNRVAAGGKVSNYPTPSSGVPNVPNLYSPVSQQTYAPTSAASIQNNQRITDIEKKINDQIANLSAGISVGGQTKILKELYGEFGISEELSLTKQYNTEVLVEMERIKKIPENIKATLQDVGISEAQFNRAVLKETQEPLKRLESLMSKKGANQEAISNALKFVSLFSDAAMKDQATKLELAKFEITTNKDLLKELNDKQKDLLNLVIDERKGILTIQNTAAENGGTPEQVSYVGQAESRQEANIRLAEMGLGMKPTTEPSDIKTFKSFFPNVDTTTPAGQQAYLNWKAKESAADRAPTDETKPTALTSEKRIILLGSGLTDPMIKNIEEGIRTIGIDKVLEDDYSEIEKKAIQKVYGKEIILTKEEIEEDMKMIFTDVELHKIAEELGYASTWTGQTTDIKRMFDEANIEELKRAISTHAK